MNFGDWEIFRMHILQLRAAEISALVESPLDESNGLGQQQQLHEWNDKTERQDRDSLGSHSRPSTAVKNDERGSERESSAKCHRKPPTAVKNTTSLEKQVINAKFSSSDVSGSEAMISGPSNQCLAVISKDSRSAKSYRAILSSKRTLYSIEINSTTRGFYGLRM